MCNALSVRDAEVWQFKAEVPELQKEMNEIHRRILGAETHICTGRGPA